MSFYFGLAVLIICVIALIYLFLVSPRVANPPDTELIRCDYAHRGLWNAKIPENSLSAFEYAARMGYGIELDIQLTKDKKIVVFHDETLKRMCGVDKKVCELTLSELRTLRLGDTEEVIPTFYEALKLINGRVPLLVEIKGDKPIPALCGGASYLLDRYRGPFCIESFSPFILRWFKRFRPTYARGQLCTSLADYLPSQKRAVGFILSQQMTNFLSRPDFIAINEKKRRNLGFLLCIHALHAKGLIWTVREPKLYVACRQSGLRTIFEGFLPKINRGIPKQ